MVAIGLSHSVALPSGGARRRRTACPQLSYSAYRFPPDIIQHAVWMYLRFTLSLRDVEELLAERGIVVTYESIRR